MAGENWFQWFYLIVFLLSILMTLLYMYKWHKHFDVHIAMVFVLVPVVNLGYVLFSRAQSLDEALSVNMLSFIGGCFLELLIMLAVFSLCNVKMHRLLRCLFFLISTGVFLSALTIGRSKIFYTDVRFINQNGIVALSKDYGWMHTVFRAMVFVYFLISLGVIIYTWFRKNQVSRKVLALLFLPEVVAMIAFFGGRQILPNVELVPLAYLFAQGMYLIIASRMALYDVAETAVDSLVENGAVGLLSIDFKYHYLGSNETAKEIFPALHDLTVDLSVKRIKSFQDLVTPWLDTFQENDTRCTQHYEKDSRIYLVKLSWLYNDQKRRGYQLTITDDTEDQRFIRLIGRYNDDLQRQVAEKTAHIEEMHDQLILSMATMVESRDNSTGGHIRRTSEGVRMLLDAMEGEETAELPEDFRKNLIKAAPMHDLGKIAVDDMILRKPGRFTPEEFEKMKAHAAEGYRIVHEILAGTDDAEFRRIAENVAHYHHERWDGSGYPDGLAGEAIPREARIMAVADVYDALVSKRVYKEKMSFEKANGIIMDGMGSQFAPEMEAVYLRARPNLEAYYSAMEAETA